MLFTRYYLILCILCSFSFFIFVRSELKSIKDFKELLICHVLIFPIVPFSLLRHCIGLNSIFYNSVRYSRNFSNYINIFLLNIFIVILCILITFPFNIYIFYILCSMCIMPILRDITFCIFGTLPGLGIILPFLSATLIYISFI